MNDNIGYEDQPALPTLDELMPKEEQMAQPLHEASARNEAATLALLGSPDTVSEDYQVMISEAQAGSQSRANAIREQVIRQSGASDFSTLLQMVGDKSVDLATKQQLVKGFNSNAYLQDPRTKLATDSLMKDSPGEDEQGFTGRVILADSMRKIAEDREEEAKLINQIGAMGSLDAGKNMVDLVTYGLTPFAMNMIVSKVAGEMSGKKGVVDYGKTVFTPGSTLKDMRAVFEALPSPERLSYIKRLSDALVKQTNLILPGSNDVARVEILRAITDPHYYDDFDKFLDNTSTVLEFVGLGATFRAATRSTKAVKGAAKGVDASQLPPPLPEAPMTPAGPIAKTPANVKPEDLAKTSGTPTANVPPPDLVAKKEALQKEYEQLLEVGGESNKGDVVKLNVEKVALESKLKSVDSDVKSLAKVYQSQRKLSYKDALSEATKTLGDRKLDLESQLSRVTNLLEKNAISSKAQQRMGAIEKEITSLDKGIKDGTVSAPVRKNYVTEALEKQRLADRVVANNHIPAANPVSPFSVISDTNPAEARNLLKAIEVGGDEVSLALAGAKADDVIAGAVLPQVIVDGGKVANKVADPFKLLEADNEIIKASRTMGASHFSAAERLSAATTITRGFKEAIGITLRDGMGGFKIAEDGRHFQVSATYGNGINTFSDPVQAIDQTKEALRGRGIRDDEITLLKRDGTGYIPTKLEEVAGVEGDYLVRVDSLQDFDFNDVRTARDNPETKVKGKLDPVTTKRNWFDRLASTVRSRGGESLNRYAFDPASMLDPLMTTAMSASKDRSVYLDKMFVELTSKFTDKLGKMPEARAKAIEQHLKEANEFGIAFDRASLLAKFTPEEVDAIHDWKKIWDTHYYFENDDLIKSLNSDGYMFFKNSNAELFAKPVAQNAPVDKVAIGINKNVSRVYDPISNTHVFQTADEIDMLYKAGGTLARLRRPVDLAGERATYIISRNDSSGYLRKFRNTDSVLNYRPMHYTRSYKGARFVDEITPDGFRRAIAVGPDTPSANAFRRGKELANPQNKYVVRDDERGIIRGNDDWFDTAHASGRLAQRHRGQILGNTEGTAMLGEGSFIVDPATSAVQAAKSLSGRIAMRPVIETAKQRIMDQYGHLFETDSFGRPQYPDSMDKIGTKGGHTTKEVGDARTAVGYMQFIEVGMANGIDDVYKQGLNALASAFGEKGFATVERGLRNVAEADIPGLTKNSVFHAYIVWANPLRQWIVQAHTSIRASVLAPKHAASGQMAKDLASAMKLFATGKADTDFAKFLDESGLIAGIDRNNLVRGSLADMAESRNPVKRTAGKVLSEYPRKIGFDVGESVHKASWASVLYQRAIDAGLNVKDKTVRDNIISEVNAFTGEMNQVGDMPYNSGAMSTLTQFLQVPHKAFLLYSNRKVDGKTKAKLLATDLALFGTPAGLIGSYFLPDDVLPEDDDGRYIMTEGLEAWTYNKIFKEFLDEEQDLDLAALNPYGLDGFAKLYMAMFEDGEWMKVAPAYHLLNPENGRLPLALKELTRYFSGEIDSNMPPATMLSVGHKVAQISSGYSAGSAAHAALEMGKWKSAAGDALPGDVTFPTAVMKSLGFGLLSQREMYKLSQERFDDEDKLKQDILKDLKATQRILSDSMNATKEERELSIRATNVMLNRYADNPAARVIIMQQIKKDLLGKDSTLMRQMFKNSGISDSAATRDQILRSNLTPEQKQQLLDRLDN